MTASIYELIGRLVVRFVRTRYRKQLRIAAALGIGAACHRRLCRAEPRAARGLSARNLAPRMQDLVQAPAPTGRHRRLHNFLTIR